MLSSDSAGFMYLRTLEHRAVPFFSQSSLLDLIKRAREQEMGRRAV